MQRLDFERAKMFQMSSVSERSRTKIAPSRTNYGRHGRPTEIIAVAIDATKSVTRHAMEWALTNVAQSGDIIILLALLPLASPSWKFWKSNSESARREKRRLEEAKRSCQYMMEQLQNLCDAKKVQTNVKIIPGAARGVTTVEANKVGATWVVLDRYLKREEKSCSEQLDCNLVIVHRFNPKILRLNLKQSPRGTPSPVVSFDSRGGKTDIILGTPASSPEVGTPFTLTDRANSSSTSCSEPSTSPFSSAEPGSCTNSTHGNSNAGVVEKLASSNDARSDHHYGYVSESDSDDSSSVGFKNLHSKFMDHSALRSLQQPKTTTLEGKQSRSSPAKQRFPSNPRLSMSMREGGSRQSLQMIMNPAPSSLKAGVSSPKLILSDLLTSLKRTSSNRSSEMKHSDKKKDRTNSEGSMFPKEQTSVRKAVSLSSHAPMGPPPLCSICQHKAPAFGRPPRAFTFAELQLATGGFSQANFLAEGGFGSVHRGVLPEGQVVAVKQHKLASSQGDVEFCSEVEVLSCAQHRNVVMLIGYCIEDSRRLLVYEFICNRSLDAHLYGGGKALEWESRQKIAVGAARGLRYLHEECRVGCIVHRDMRPNNILLTHDYEPMVGDFGLARWQPDGELGVETRVIGTFGYLAPEYTQSGQITEKADVYSFGVVLLELVTGRKAIDISRPKGQQCLTEWARPLLRKQANYELVDPKLGNCYDKDEVSLMLYAASLCICRDPNMRPRMSQVLRILEGELTFDVTSAAYNGQNGNAKPGSEATPRRSMSAFSGRHNRITSPKPREDLARFASSELSHHISHAGYVNSTNGKLSLEELKAAYRDKVSHRRLSHGDL